MTVTTSLYRADVRNGLSFAHRAYLPVNIGSASLLGVKIDDLRAANEAFFQEWMEG